MPLFYMYFSQILQEFSSTTPQFFVSQFSQIEPFSKDVAAFAIKQHILLANHGF